MKIVISESQYQRLIEVEQERKVLHIPSLKVFGLDRLEAWNNLQEFLERKGNPPYSIGGNLVLAELPIESLGNLKSVGRALVLSNSLIKSLGNLESVGDDLYLNRTPIQSLGNLKFVGGDLYLRGTPISQSPITGVKVGGGIMRG